MRRVPRILRAAGVLTVTAVSLELLILEARDRRVRAHNRRLAAAQTHTPFRDDDDWGLTWADPDDDDVDLEFTPVDATPVNGYHYRVDEHGVLHRNPLPPEDRDFWLPNGQDGGWALDGYWHTSRDDAVGY